MHVRLGRITCCGGILHIISCAVEYAHELNISTRRLTCFMLPSLFWRLVSVNRIGSRALNVCDIQWSSCVYASDWGFTRPRVGYPLCNASFA
jgi:hypothetical protein